MKHWLQSLLLIALLAGAPTRAPGQNPSERQTWNLRDPVERARLLDDLRVETDRARTSAWAVARAQGWRERGQAKGRNYQLRAIENGVPLVDIENNVNAAISTAANLIRNTAPYNVNGTNVTVGVWDGGGVRATHQELAGRVTIMDGAALGDHATHVGGTIAAGGVVAAALGMAPRVRIDSYEWTSDTIEMTARGMVTNAQSGRIPLSNHSYGSVTGWDEGDWSGTYGVHWFGSWGPRESSNFGLYDPTARSWDLLCAAAPYFLPFKAAGNDRDDTAPANGTTFYYYYLGSWLSKTYDSATDPYSDGWDNGGFDTISTYGVAKNIMTIGSVADAVSGGNRSLGNATMSSFSGWGPADDGRIKPDVVANGESLNSSLAGSDSSYALYTGTSMSTPNAAGSAALLVDYYLKLSTGNYMRASTLKGLLIHTADDLGNAGPDYKFGWGLLNVKAAADHLQRHFANVSSKYVEENFISTLEAARTNQMRWDTTNAIRVTLSWTDVAGTARTTLDLALRCLVNDINLSVIGPNGETNLPYVMPFVQNRSNPDGVATNGVNNTDNIEQVYLANPSGAGHYSIVVARGASMVSNTQRYSLVVSGVLPQEQDSVSLTITGAPYQVGSPMPGYGTTTNAYGVSTQAVVFGRATNVDATSWAALVCTGWTRTGSAPATGATTNTGSFTLTANTTVQWHWVISDLIVSNQTVVSAVTNQPRDTLRARDGYSVVSPGSATLRAGQSVRLEEGFRAGTGSTVIIRSP